MNAGTIKIVTTYISDKTSKSELLPAVDSEIIEPDSLQSPIRKYFTTKKILWTFDDYWINENHFPPHKGYGGLSEQIHTYGGYVGIMAPFIPKWIGQKFGNQIRNYSVVDEFSVYTSRFSQAYVNKSLEFFNRSYIEPECHGWNHSEDLNHATLSYAYQIINFTLWNWYNNYHIKPKFWLGHNYDGNYNISLALKKFSENYWTVYAEYFTVNSEELFPNHIEPAVEYIGIFFDPYFGCTYGHPCKTVQEAQQRFTTYSQNKEIVAIRGHPLFLNGTEPRATENLTKWQQFIDWVYQAHTYININHSQAIYYKIDRNNFSIEKNNDDNYTIDLTYCQFDHTILFTNPDETNQWIWVVSDQTGESIGIVSEDVFLPLKSGMKYFMVTDPYQEPEPPAWWNINWNYRKEIILDHTKVSSTIVNFPVLIQITDLDLKAHAQPTGYDIVFTDTNGIKLNHEIETYRSITGELTAWINIPSLSTTSDTIIYMYYGNPEAINQENIDETWDTNYLAVHHLDETSGTIVDSTVHNNDGVPSGSPNRNVNGKIDGADAFDGVNDHFTLPRVYTNENQFTMEAWIYAQNGARYFISQRSGSSQGVFIQMTGGNYLQYYINGFKDGKTITLNTWHHIVLTYDGSTAKLYTNGVAKSKSCSPPTWPSEGMCLGDRLSGNRQFYGLIDEVRFSNIARSNAWVTTSYTNQNNPSAFITISPEES